jgi:hypothetical protein
LLILVSNVLTVALEMPVAFPQDDFDAIVAGQLAELAAADPAALQAAHPAWHPEDCRIKALAAGSVLSVRQKRCSARTGPGTTRNSSLTH